MLAERVKTWTEEWKQQGVEQARREGRQEGRREGKHLGEASLLRRLLDRRFGPLPAWVDERLAQAGEAELEQWAERVLECASLEEVFRVAP